MAVAGLDGDALDLPMLKMSTILYHALLRYDKSHGVVKLLPRKLAEAIILKIVGEHLGRGT